MTPMSGPAAPAQGRRRPLLRLALLAALLAGGAMGALAQSGPPIPSQPVYPQPPQSYPAPQPSYPGPQAYPQPSPQASPQRELSPQEIRCLQLEQELANEWTTRTGSDRADQLSQIDEEIRKQDRIFQGTQAAMERGSCYESVFIFGKALVRSPKCLRMNDTVEEARRQLARLQQQRQALSNPGTARRRQDELIDALARAGCGRQYQQDARRRDSGGGFFSNFFGGQDDYPRRNLETSRIESFATYRTLCVRTCDGFYFPISYSTLPTQFNNDIAACQAQCAAPAELFVHRNPGEEAEQMVSANGVTAYASTPNAFRFRKEYVKGCSCKVTEYNPAEIETYNQKAEAEGKIKGVTPAPRVAQDKAPQPLKRPQ